MKLLVSNSWPTLFLIEKGGLTVRDSSINSSNPNDAKDPDYIKSRILAPQIQWASTLLVYITPDTKDSEWVNWEIEYAEKQGKRIIGVWDHGAAGVDIPDALEKFGKAVVGWQADKIKGAIEGTVNNWESPDGVIAPPRDVKRYSC